MTKKELSLITLSSIALTPEFACSLADTYNIPEFVANDPIQFPRRYTRKQDIEISGFISQWMSFGRRTQIVLHLDKLHQNELRDNPYDYIVNRQYLHHKDLNGKMYRFLSHDDYFKLCERLRMIYLKYDSLEDAVIDTNNNPNIANKPPYSALSELFNGINGIPQSDGKSAFKKLNMFCRWMIRNDGIVDLGIWKKISPEELVIPLDVHVHRQAIKYGICTMKDNDIKTAMHITNWFRDVFPNDPAKGDFVLFGLGVNGDEVDDEEQ